MRKSSNQVPERGDLICIEWWDIEEDPTGNVSSSDVPLRSTYSLFWEILTSPGDPTLKILRTTNTRDSIRVVDQSGYTVYPLTVVKQITVLKKAKKAGIKRGPRRFHLSLNSNSDGGLPSGSVSTLAETIEAGGKAKSLSG